MLILGDFEVPGLGVLGYGISALLYLAFCGALATQWRGRLRGVAPRVGREYTSPSAALDLTAVHSGAYDSW